MGASTYGQQWGAHLEGGVQLAGIGTAGGQASCRPRCEHRRQARAPPNNAKVITSGH